MNEGHARLSCSNHRWPHCPGSVREEERYPDIPGEAAIDGTGSHLLLEMCLKNNVQAFSYEQQVIGLNHPDNPHGWLVQVDRIERVQMALNYIARRVDELTAQFPDCNVLVESESRSDPGGAYGRKDWNGTCDVTLIARHKMTGEVYFVETIDYKDGREYVKVIDNTQLHSYLFGKLRPYIASGPDLVRPFRFKTIQGFRMTIVQPKTNPVIRYQCSTRAEDNLTVDGFLEFMERLSDAANATDDPNAPLIPGAHCRWCKANPKRGGHCTASTDQSLQNMVMNMSNELVVNDSSDIIEYLSKAVADPKSLTEEQLANLADAEAGVQAIFDKVKEEITTRLNQGIFVPGYAMEPGKGSNKWNEDEKVIEKKLKACRLKKQDIYVEKLISPAQMKSLDKLTDTQKERLWKDLVTYIAGNKTLKKVARTSPPATTDAFLMFGDVANKPATDEVSFF